ncbi:MAG: hypothetical protein AB1646_08450 [Thermodesulfobacteriota bacterium]
MPRILRAELLEGRARSSLAGIVAAGKAIQPYHYGTVSHKRC